MAEQKNAPAKTADDYQAAVDAVFEVVGLAAAAVIPGGKAALAVQAALPVVKAAAKVAPQVGKVAQPALGKMADAAPDVAQKAGVAIGDAAAGVAGAVGAAAKRVFDPIGDALDARKEEQARAEARRVILEGAGVRMSVERFRENK